MTNVLNTDYTNITLLRFFSFENFIPVFTSLICLHIHEGTKDMSALILCTNNSLLHSQHINWE